MFGAVKIFLVILQLSYLRGQLLLVPVVPYHEDSEDINVWDDDSNNYAQFYLESHLECDKYEIVIDNKKVPCENYVEILRKPSENEVKIKKRDVDELEGSGEDPPIIEVEEKINKQTNESQSENAQNKNTTDFIQQKPTENTLPEETKENLENSTAQTATNQSKKILETTPASQEGTPKVFAPTVLETSTYERRSEVTEKPVETPATQNSTTEQPTENGSTEKPLDEGKKGRRLPPALPTDLAEERKGDSEKEAVDEHQSGNAVMDVKEREKSQNLEGLKETEDTLGKQQPNSEHSEQPDAGQSSEDIKKGATKDTTILFLLFGAVLVVFAVGFAYSLVKRRKERKQQKRIANDVTIIRKSLQNLAQQNAGQSDDIESGTEMKPLMKNSIPEESTVSSKSEK